MYTEIRACMLLLSINIRQFLKEETNCLISHTLLQYYVVAMCLSWSCSSRSVCACVCVCMWPTFWLTCPEIQNPIALAIRKQNQSAIEISKERERQYKTKTYIAAFCIERGIMLAVLVTKKRHVACNFSAVHSWLEKTINWPLKSIMQWVKMVDNAKIWLLFYLFAGAICHRYVDKYNATSVIL